MKYLILRTFTSYGKLLRKGTIVDEEQIRSPRLRMSEGKLVVAEPIMPVFEEELIEDAFDELDDVLYLNSLDEDEDGDEDTVSSFSSSTEVGVAAPTSDKEKDKNNITLFLKK